VTGKEEKMGTFFVAAGVLVAIALALLVAAWLWPDPEEEEGWGEFEVPQLPSQIEKVEESKDESVSAPIDVGRRVFKREPPPLEVKKLLAQRQQATYKQGLAGEGGYKRSPARYEGDTMALGTIPIDDSAKQATRQLENSPWEIKETRVVDVVTLGEERGDDTRSSDDSSDSSRQPERKPVVADWSMSFDEVTSEDPIPSGSFDDSVESTKKRPPLEAISLLEALPAVSEKTGELEEFSSNLTPAGRLKRKRAMRVLERAGERKLNTPLPDSPPPEAEETSQATVLAVVLKLNGDSDDASPDSPIASSIPSRPATPPPATPPPSTPPPVRSNKPTLPGQGQGSTRQGENYAVSGSTTNRPPKK